MHFLINCITLNLHIAYNNALQMFEILGGLVTKLHM